MRRSIALCLFLACAPALSGCAVVSATGEVIGAAGTLVSATANVTASAIGSVAGGGHHHDKKPDCAGADKDTDACTTHGQ